MLTWLNNSTFCDHIKNDLIRDDFISDEKGQDLVEYSLVLVLIGTVSLIVISGLGFSIGDLLSTILQKLESVSSVIT